MTDTVDTPDAASPVRIADHEQVRILTLDRPPANAIDETLLTALDTALTDIAQDDAVRAVVLTGHGRFFSGGFDLRAPRRDDTEAARAAALYRDTHRRLLALLKPTVALVNGHAIAGGFVLALACDRRLAVDGPFTIGMNEVAIGASFPSAASAIVRGRLTGAMASELMLGAELSPLPDGLRTGFVERLVSADDAMDEAIALATKLGSYPRDVFAHTKQTLVQRALDEIDSVSMEEELSISALWRTAESRAARAAQREKLTH